MWLGDNLYLRVDIICVDLLYILIDRDTCGNLYVYADRKIRKYDLSEGSVWLHSNDERSRIIFKGKK